MISEIVLLIMFLIFFLVGFFIIYKQVALIKKGEFNIRDRFQCLIYGFIFSSAVLIVLAMAFIFTVNTPEFWVGSPIIPEKINPLILLLPFIFSLTYISIYPLIDFLFIALGSQSNEGLTPFHRIIRKHVINRFQNKFVSVIMAFALYLLFIIPPLILALLGLPFIMIWISWMLVYPLMILTFYGSKGYIAGITNEYYHIPEIKRFIFLNFENKERNTKLFLANPKPYIFLGLMIFVFVWAWISMVQTIIFFFSGTLAISTMTSYFVFVTLFFGIVGYFTRFWGRKVKYRGIDIYFAAYLMAAIGVNVLVNFLIVNSEKLTETFNFWPITTEIVPNYILFTWASVIEEIFLIIFTSYYFLSKTSEFTKNLKYSKITEYGQTFDSIPLFNLIINKDPRIRKHAEETLTLMYERIPKKTDIDINEWKYKDLLMDSICSLNPQSKRVASEIFRKLQFEIPNQILPWINEALSSANYEKSIGIIEILQFADQTLINKIPLELIINLLNDPEWRLRTAGLKLISRLVEHNEKIITKINIKQLLNDPNSSIQVELLNILAKTSYKLSPKIFFEKLEHSNNKIRAAIIGNLNNLDIDKLSSKLIGKIVSIIKDPTSSVRASIFKVISKIGNFKKYSIPILPIIESLNDSDQNVRNTALLALEKAYIENSHNIDLNLIFSKIDAEDSNSLITILTLLGKIWDKDPEQILTTLLIFIKFDNQVLKDTISSIIISNFKKNPDLIFNKLIQVKDETKFISKGIIARTIIELGKKYPSLVIPRLEKSLLNNENFILINTISSLEDLIEDYSDQIRIQPVITTFNRDIGPEIRKDISQFIVKAVKLNPKMHIDVLYKFLESPSAQDTSIKIILSKGLLEIIKKETEVIQIKPIIELISNQDSFIRETATKILSYTGKIYPEETTEALFKMLKDSEWIVRNAAVSSIGNNIERIRDKNRVIEELVKVLEDDNSWVQNSAMKVLSSTEGIDGSQVPYSVIVSSLKSEDPKIREGCAKLLKIHGKDYTERIGDDLIILLGDKVEEVRNAAITVAIEIINTIGLSRILSQLLKNLSDETSIETQQSIARILGRAARYEDEKIKKRVIALLKIRCEVSQDPIICENLTKIRES